MERFTYSSAVSSFPAAAIIYRSCWVNKRVSIVRYHKWHFISWCWLRLNVGILDYVCLQIPWLVSFKNRTTDRRFLLFLILIILFEEWLSTFLLRNRSVFVLVDFLCKFPVFPVVLLNISLRLEFCDIVLIMAFCQLSMRVSCKDLLCKRCCKKYRGCNLFH